jgi:hypothetical protein
MAMTATVLIAPARQKAGSSKWTPGNLSSHERTLDERPGAIVIGNWGIDIDLAQCPRGVHRRFIAAARGEIGEKGPVSRRGQVWIPGSRPLAAYRGARLFHTAHWIAAPRWWMPVRCSLGEDDRDAPDCPVPRI